MLVLRLTGIALLVSIAWFIPWLALNMARDQIWLAVPFLLCNLILAFNLCLMVVNNWERRTPPPRTVELGAEPLIGVLIPTAGEPVEMVMRTVRSVLEQDWPRDRLRIVVSDDGHDPQLRRAVRALAEADPHLRIQYNDPPPRDRRRGTAKAGNLNSALAALTTAFPDEQIHFIETRDADDMVGDAQFLRRVVGHLLSDPKTAYVQTIKDARVREGDPFNNRELIFYREVMQAKHAANAVFPCGSGLVWRAEALRDIGNFPSWNLVEDLHSGVEALRRGWRGAFVPVVGALAQHAPHDIPNVYKQRGTWAMDTARLLVHGDLRGLKPRQYAQFLEMALYYVQGAAIIVLGAIAVWWLLFDAHPVVVLPAEYALHFIPFIVASEVYFIAFTGRQPYSAWWRIREMMFGLAPVFARTFAQAVIAGRDRKPVYRVTRKTDQFLWYWRETLPQMLMVAIVVGAVAFALLARDVIEPLSLGGLYFIALLVIYGAGFVRKGWYGVPAGPIGYLRRHYEEGRQASGGTEPSPWR
ncbi:MAG TPA: glycosyltransferase [Candidatus Limnocylindrales bacterium]|nr:glycosyltransferase [Candidatus Limnocylindrales bacterium]